METSPESSSSRSHLRRHSSLSGNSLGHYSFPSSPRHSLSTAEPASHSTFSSSISTLPSHSDKADGNPVSRTSNLRQLQQLHNVLKEQNTLLQQLAAKAAVALDKRGEPIPENFLRAPVHRKRTSIAQSLSSRCFSSSHIEPFPDAPSVNPQLDFASSRRHSVAFTPSYHSSWSNSPLPADDHSEYAESQEYDNNSYDHPFRSLVDSDVAELQGLIFSKRVELCAPVSGRETFHPSTEDLDSDFFALTSKRNSIFPGCPASDWKYCVPTFPSDAVSDEWQVARGSFPTIGACPNYVPPWEIYDHPNGNSYHIDDVDLSWPFDRSDPLEFETHDVPYSFSAPFPVRLNGQPRLARTGLTVGRTTLSASLGSLFSAPPDSRIPLSFERNELRLLCASPDGDDEITSYLSQVQSHLQKLHHTGGTFSVRDFTFWMRSTLYHWIPDSRFDDDPDSDSDPPHWLAVKSAINAEQRGLMIVPTSHYVVTRSRLPVLERARQWYRLIYYQGLEKTLDPDGDILEQSQESLELLLYNRIDAPRLSSSRRRALLQTFEWYLSSLSPSLTGRELPVHSTMRHSRFDHSWSPLCVSWITAPVVPSPDSKGGGGTSVSPARFSLRLGNLTFPRASASLLLFPHSASHDVECIRGPSEPETGEYIDKGQYYWSILLLSSVGLDTCKFRYPYTVALEIVERVFQHVLSSWNDVSDAMFTETPLPSPSTDEPDNLTSDSTQPVAVFSLRPDVRVDHHDLSHLSAMIETSIHRWQAYKRSRLPLFHRHHEIYQHRYSAFLETLATRPLHGEPVSDLHLTVDQDTVGSVAESIDRHVDALEILRIRFEHAATATRTEFHHRQARKSMSLISGSFMAALRLDESVELQNRHQHLVPEFFKNEFVRIILFAESLNMQKWTTLVLGTVLTVLVTVMSFFKSA